MIPPLQQIRLRSISRWMQDNRKTEFQKLTRSGELNNRVTELDAQMIETFETNEDQLKNSMMDNQTWGTEAGLTQFQTQRLEMWNQVVQDFLPVTSDQGQED